MANHEHRYCHAKDFCPFERVCAVGSVGTLDFSPTSICMEKGDIAWSNTNDDYHVYVVKSGLFASFIPFEDGYETLLALFSRGLVLGVSDIWMCKEARCSYGVKCLSPGVICKVSATSVKAYIESRPNALEIVVNLMTNNTSCGLELTRILRSGNAREKLTYLFLALRDMLPGSQNRRTFYFTQDELGEIVAEKRLSVKRALDALEAEGALTCQYGKVTVSFARLKPLFSSAFIRAPLFYAPK